MARLNVLIVSRSKSAADHLSQDLSGHPEFLVNTRVMGNGHADPLHGISETPDVLLLHHKILCL